MMKKILSYFFLIFLLNIIACQKGIHWEFDSKGELLKDAADNCMSATVDGTYLINKPVNDSNSLTVSVAVTAAGSYSIVTDSVNGFMYKASGFFNNTGNKSVKLNCIGTPLKSGISHFNIRYNTSVCEADVIVLADTVADASYTLQGAPDKCMNDTIKGSYLQSVALDTLNKVLISVDVKTPGKYSILTNTVNGYSFSGKGIFTTAGIQSVVINGEGTPLKAGEDLFVVKTSNVICSFSIQVSQIIQTSNPLHFPLTAGSYWMYDDLKNYDTVRRDVNGDTTVDNTSFVKVTEIAKNNAFYMQNFFYNYDGGNYNQFQRIGYNYYEWNYDPSIYGLMPILKEYCKPGDSWQSDVFTGKVNMDFRNYYYQCTFSCVSNNAIKTVNGLTFKDVIIIAVYPLVKADPWIQGESIYVFGGWNNIFYSYYAKGVGLIDFEESDDAGASTYPLLQIINWKVN